MDAAKVTKYKIFQLQNQEEDRLVAIHHQEIQKQQQKSWHDRKINTKNISVNDLVLLYDSKIKGKLGKLETTWLGPCIVEEMNSNNTTRLRTLQG